MSVLSVRTNWPRPRSGRMCGGSREGHQGWRRADVRHQEFGTDSGCGAARDCNWSSVRMRPRVGD
uniref:Uncharacterized protein n=1 Tax=Setaria italica TaxID=4555 RepID=K4ANR7_SETIT